MPTLTLPKVSYSDIAAVEDFARSTPDLELRELFTAIVGLLREGVDVVTLDEVETPTLTPNDAARRLGMSRTHLCKLLDRGEIPFHRVGRDRRIVLDDVVAFEARRQSEKRRLAEAFAHRDETRAAVDDALADLL